jgi:hypothetical protein
MSSRACRWWDDETGLIAEVEENAVLGLGSDHYLIGRGEGIASGFFQFLLQFEQVFGELKNSAAACAPAEKIKMRVC